jgi:hypothetical protein
MRLGAFFSLPLVVLAIAPSQIAASFQPKVTVTAPTETSTRAKPLILAAKGDRIERIRFARGASAATIQTSVIRGSRDTFLLSAQRRQTLTVSVTSLEKNAVFDIKGPNGKLIKQEVTNWSGVLPATGDYRIIVGGTRGNANYRLRVSVK